MSNTIEKLPNEPILVQTVDPEFSIKTQAGDMIERTLKFLDQQIEPVIYIIDMSQTSMDFEDIVMGASVATRQFALFKHPKVRETIAISSSSLASAAARGLNSPIFGYVKLKVVKTLDEALAYARESVREMRRAS